MINLIYGLIFVLSFIFIFIFCRNPVLFKKVRAKVLVTFLLLIYFVVVIRAGIHLIDKKDFISEVLKIETIKVDCTDNSKNDLDKLKCYSDGYDGFSDAIIKFIKNRKRSF